MEGRRSGRKFQGRHEAGGNGGWEEDRGHRRAPEAWTHLCFPKLVHGWGSGRTIGEDPGAGPTIYQERDVPSRKCPGQETQGKEATKGLLLRG